MTDGLEFLRNQLECSVQLERLDQLDQLCLQVQSVQLEFRYYVLAHLFGDFYGIDDFLSLVYH